MKKRIFALIMSVCMLISMIPVSAIASDHVHDASCGYVEAKACDHSHNTECGYAEAVEGAACGHNCSDGTCAFKAAIEGTPCNHSCDFYVCGYYPAIPGTPCDKGCSEIVDGEILHEDCDYSEGEPGSPCTHAHDSACGYTVAVAGTACDHSHNDACGYVAVVEGSACTHSCTDGTCSYTAGSPCTYVEPTHTHSLGGWHQDGEAGHYKNCIDCPENYREETVPHSFAAACDVSCDLCGYNRGVQSSPHSFSGATCITKGSCPCGEEGDVNSANHAGGTETRGYEAAGEFSDGYTGDTYCLGCGDKISSGSTIPATHAHSWEWTHDSGMHWQKCDCGESSTAAQAHQFDDDADATCDTCGYVRTVEGMLSITGSMPAATVGEAYSASFGYTGTVSGVVFWNATGLPDG